MFTDLSGIEQSGVRRALIDDLLNEQQLLTPVARFSREHERHELPAQQKYYRDLIPLSSPKPGEQYAFAVDLDACTGCKACVTACHNLNGLDDEETWRDVGMLFGGTVIEPVQQTVTTACHHCLDPACMNGCPVKAYDKDPITGIVRHLDDQCIGCQYCIWKCPYDVPKYSKKRGIVRKCDMCSSRLAAGEAPACVQACPNEAIRITTVDKKQIRLGSRDNSFLPGAPDPNYTLPTTQYRTRESLPSNMRPADFFKNKPGHSHPPLVAMLVLTQLSVGAFCTAMILRVLFPPELTRVLTPFHSLVAVLLGFIALGASTLHLGRPIYAWRAFIGLKTSWLSREIIVFGLFATLALIYAGSFWLPALSRFANIPFGRELSSPAFQNALGIGVAISGLAGVFCSIMIYRDTRRTFWRTVMTAPKFFGTTLLLGPATILFAITSQSVFVPAIAAQPTFYHIICRLCGFLAVATTAKLLWELAVFVHLNDPGWTNMKRTALLMSGALRRATITRFACGVLGGAVLPLVALFGILDPVIVTGILAFSLLGELLERYLFFTAVIPLKMPGGIAS
jgi:formate dehydrogenase iron-sulfur subunit